MKKNSVTHIRSYKVMDGDKKKMDKHGFYLIVICHWSENLLGEKDDGGDG